VHTEKSLRAAASEIDVDRRLSALLGTGRRLPAEGEDAADDRAAPSRLAARLLRSGRPRAGRVISDT
jgi:hypothetical protein